jgi:hypothetical protein
MQVIKHGLIHNDDDHDDHDHDHDDDDKLQRIIPKQELGEVCKSPRLIADIKMRIFMCQGHATTLRQTRVAKPEGGWKMGGPRLRWMKDPGNVLPELKAESRKQRANARKEY